MSITRALSSAVSGLQASARGTETVASNLANIMTPGYARRSMELSSQALSGGLGGVQVEGVRRIVNMTLVAEGRAASAAQADAQSRADFLQGMERLIGVAGEAGSLGSALSEFQAAIVAATARPDDNIRLTNIVSTATGLAGKLNQIGDGIQAARGAADQAIAVDVSTLNDGLNRVADLNRRITVLKASGVDILSLEDERQAIVDQLSQIVPMQQVDRPGGKIALFATGGAVLLDGMEPKSFGFQRTSVIAADLTLAAGDVDGLTYDGKPVNASRMAMFAGGSLEANFAIRDNLAPGLQREMDAIALDLHDRLADPSVDTTRGGLPGLFTDTGVAASVASIVGLASRIAVNAAVDPSAGGEIWRIRAGIGAATPGPVGDSGLLVRMTEVLSDSRDMTDTASFDGRASLDNFVGQLSSRVSTRRVSADAELAVRNARFTTLSSRLMADGVDSDDEMRRLLEYEQAYSANAKVIQTIDEMMSALLRI